MTTYQCDKCEKQVNEPHHLETIEIFSVTVEDEEIKILEMNICENCKKAIENGDESLLPEGW